MPNLFVKETWIDRTRNCQLGESGVYESFTDDAGKLYKSLQREYGRCTGRVYVDTECATIGGTPTPKRIGWVFVKRTPYEDSRKTPPESFLLETWVSVHSAPDTVTREEHFATL